MTDAENRMLVAIHRDYHCSPRITTSIVNGNPADFEVAVTWTRLIRHNGYSRAFEPQAVRAPTLAEALSMLIEVEARFDAGERARLNQTPREENDRGE